LIRRILLQVILVVLVYGFWISPDFKEISAGVAIFLFGMLFLEEGFRTFTGGLLEKILRNTTDRLWKSISFGIFTTTIMQSSSLVSVITISFLSAGLIELASGIGIIFGANIGTTTGAWLIAGLGMKVNVSAYAMPMLVFGIILVFQKSNSLKGVGYILAGLGFLFLGIHHMKEGFEAFRNTIDLTEFAVSGVLGLFLFTAMGVFATVVMQSSHATLVLIITALAAQQITYENALALAIGANVGTTITAIIGSMSANYQGKRLAGAHLVFNFVTGLIAIILINQFVTVVDVIADYVGIAEDDYTLKLAVFHTIFNAVGVIIMIPFINHLVRSLERVLPAPTLDLVGTKYLNSSVLDFPETLVEAVRNETFHLYENAFEIIAHGINLHRSEILSGKDLEELIKNDRKAFEINFDDIYERKVKVLFNEIIDFISRGQGQIPPEYSSQLYNLRQANRLIVRGVKGVKHLRKNLKLYVMSDNHHIRDEYNALRLQIACLLRDLDHLRNLSEEDREVLELDTYKANIEQKTSVEDGRIDRLIRKSQITSGMATSLLNDHGYTRDLIRSLVDIGMLLYGSKDAAQGDAEALVGLNGVDLVENTKDE